MKFVVEITNEKDSLEADVSASDSGLKPSKPSFHLMLGPAPRGDIVLTPHGGTATDVVSLAGNCRRHGIDPQRYLTSVLGKIGTIKLIEPDQFLPVVWKSEDAAEPQKA